MYKIFFIFFSISIFFVSYSLSQSKKAINKIADKSELEQKKKRLQQEIFQYNRELEETKKDKRTSMKSLIILNQKIMKRQALINNINDELEYTSREIFEKVNNINQLNNQLKKLQNNYGRMILSAYKNRHQSNILTFIIRSKDFNQSLRRTEYIKRIAIARNKQVTEIKSVTLVLNENVQKLEIIKEDQSKLLDSKEKEKEIFDNEKQEKEKVVAQLQIREKELKQQIKKKQEDANKLSNAIRKLIEEEVRKAREIAIADAKKKKKEIEKTTKEKVEKQKKENPSIISKTSKEDQKKIDNANKELEDAESAKGTIEVFALSSENQKLSSNFENNKNKLPWPVSAGAVISSFGEHEHPVLKGIKIKNNGIDIKTKQNAESRTVFDGEVTGVINIPGAGKAIIIRHGEYLSVYSNLANTTVNKGDKVKAKQTIGTVANGEIGGELHFEIWKGQTTQNPQIWLGLK